VRQQSPPKHRYVSHDNASDPPPENYNLQFPVFPTNYLTAVKIFSIIKTFIKYGVLFQYRDSNVGLQDDR
jgi:hypothetical protein